MAEIRKCMTYLQRSQRLEEQDVGPLLILPLHGYITTHQQPAL
jgi:HrpA-like RNA helicase